MACPSPEQNSTSYYEGTVSKQVLPEVGGALHHKQITKSNNNNKDETM